LQKLFDCLKSFLGAKSLFLWELALKSSKFGFEILMDFFQGLKGKQMTFLLTKCVVGSKKKQRQSNKQKRSCCMMEFFELV
jgi:hypothetical protein